MSELKEKEKAVAQKATKAVRSALRNAISKTTERQTGTAENTVSSKAIFKKERLQRITISAQHYIFKQHFGFEGSKKNGVNMRLKATNVLNIALDNTNALEYLADSISDIRSEQVISQFIFRQNG